MGSLLSIGDTDISEDVVGSFSLHARAVSTPVTDNIWDWIYICCIFVGVVRFIIFRLSSHFKVRIQAPLFVTFRAFWPAIIIRNCINDKFINKLFRYSGTLYHNDKETLIKKRQINNFKLFYYHASNINDYFCPFKMTEVNKPYLARFDCNMDISSASCGTSLANKPL